MRSARDSNGLSDLARGLCDYLYELNAMHSICAEHQEVAAIHTTSSKALEVYRLFPSNSSVTDNLRKAVKKLHKWSELSTWKYEGGEWEKMKKQITNRVKKHVKQHEVLTEGVEWLGR
ncbi:MAG: hypothetical protein HOD34_03335, partial [Candidatus Peribacter sp.]|nr:hypothetical protein [Candidatus Peribacter sp.]